MLKAGRGLHGTACAETLVRKGRLVGQRGHTADKSWTQGSVLLLTPVPHTAVSGLIGHCLKY